MKYLGDFDVGVIVRHLWATNGADGASITRGTNGTVHVYKDLSASTEVTTGVTDTEDFDSLTGVHALIVDMSSDGTFYSTGSDFFAVLKAATIDGKVVNTPLCHWSVGKRSALRPTTAQQTLDVSAGGEAGIDWGNVGNPTATLALSGTTVGVTSGAVTAVVAGVRAMNVESIGSITLQQALSSILAVCAGVSAGTVFSDPSGAASRVTFTISGNNRTVALLNPST